MHNATMKHNVSIGMIQLCEFSLAAAVETLLDSGLNFHLFQLRCLLAVLPDFPPNFLAAHPCIHQSSHHREEIAVVNGKITSQSSRFNDQDWARSIHI